MAVVKSDSEFTEETDFRAEPRRWVQRGTGPWVTVDSSAVPRRFPWGSEERAESHPTPPCWCL